MPPLLSKRAFTQLGLATGAAALMPPAHALPVRALAFPRDHGAHPDHRTEWWYITGYAKVDNRDIGFQITFFRSRVEATQSMQSQFAAKQLLFAHCAVTDVQGKQLWHDQRIARAGFGIAQALQTDTHVTLRNWTLLRNATTGVYSAQIKARDFQFDLQFSPTQALLLQGDQGLSRKGPDARQASYYYSRPQLRASGTVLLNGKSLNITSGTAWLDHEWSQELLHPEAVGWDWIGMNLFDGSSITAFQLRRKDGSALWTGGSYRDASSTAKNAIATTTIAQPSEVKFQALQRWTSPLTAAQYPTEWRITTPAGTHTVRALIPNQELDSRSSTGAVYWEGLSDLFDSNGQHVGRGYLEMTGYAGVMRI
jgi:predicted secreted hydrolase